MKEKMKELSKKSAVCFLWLSLMLTSVLVLTVPAFAIPEAQIATVKGNCVDTFKLSASGQETWLDYFCLDANLAGIAMGDIDGDGLAEVLTVKGNCVDVFTLSASGLETWLNYFCDVPLTAIAMGDIDGDGLSEVVTAGNNNNVVVWDISASGDATILHVFGYGLVTSMAMGDIDGDGTAELLTAKGNCVDVFDISATGQETPLDYFCLDANLTAIAAGDIDGDRTAEVLTVKGNCVDVWDISASGQETPLDYFCLDANLTAIAAGDIDGDGKAEVLTVKGNCVDVWDISASGQETPLDYLCLDGPITGIAIKSRNRAPVALCKNVSVVAGSNCTADASIDNGSYDPEGDTITIVQTPAGPYVLGSTVVTLTVTDSEGASSSCQSTVTVIDNTPPVITGLTVSEDCLWSPNHKMVDVVLGANVSDNCGSVTTTITAISVTSDEPTASIRGAGGKGGDASLHAPDAGIVSGDIVSLRAERSGTGNGRVYEITANVTATDAVGNTTTATGLTVQVVVPHDEADDCTAVDSGQYFDATGIN